MSCSFSGHWPRIWSTRKNNSYLSLSFLDYFGSDWRGISRLEEEQSLGGKGGDALCCSISLRNNSLCQSTALVIFELRVDFGSKRKFYSHFCYVGKKSMEKEWCFKGQCMSPFTSPSFLKSYPEAPQKLASVPSCCDCFSSVHCLLYILLFGGVSREELQTVLCCLESSLYM